MRIKEKLLMKSQDLIQYGPATIVAFGDSVTQGAVATNEMNYETVYWNRLRLKLQSMREEIPINVINAGICGITAKESLARMDAQVLSHSPDLVIVCFGLNDINGSLEEYISSLEIIFQKCLDKQIDTVFMSPNMLNTYVADDVEAGLRDYAAKTAEMQNSGRMDLYMQSACQLAKSMGVTVCDCYSDWKQMHQTQDTTRLLANRINHPIKEMHACFADRLFDLIWKDIPDPAEKDHKQ